MMTGPAVTTFEGVLDLEAIGILTGAVRVMEHVA
jgi:hypothetical protein